MILYLVERILEQPAPQPPLKRRLPDEAAISWQQFMIRLATSRPLPHQLHSVHEHQARDRMSRGGLKRDLGGDEACHVRRR
jgi:hypothetical protein